MPLPIPPTADRNKPDLVQSAPPSPKPPWPHHPVSSGVGGIYLRVLRVSGCSSNFGFFASKKGLTLRRPERYKVYGIPENHGSRSSNTNGREKEKTIHMSGLLQEGGVTMQESGLVPGRP